MALVQVRKPPPVRTALYVFVQLTDYRDAELHAQQPPGLCNKRRQDTSLPATVSPRAVVRATERFFRHQNFSLPDRTSKLSRTCDSQIAMWLLPAFLSATLLVAGTAVAKKTPAERFDEYHAKSLRASPLRLSEVSYTSLTAAPRDFGAAILLTAMDSRVNCQLCREVQPEWNLVGKSWTKGDKAGESRLLFGTLDFTDGRDIFMSVRYYQRAP